MGSWSGLLYREDDTRRDGNVLHFIIQYIAHWYHLFTIECSRDRSSWYIISFIVHSSCPLLLFLFVIYFPTLFFVTKKSQQEFHDWRRKKWNSCTDTWRKTNNIPDSDVIEAPAEHKERESRESHWLKERSIWSFTGTYIIMAAITHQET